MGQSREYLCFILCIEGRKGMATHSAHGPLNPSTFCIKFKPTSKPFNKFRQVFLHEGKMTKQFWKYIPNIIIIFCFTLLYVSELQYSYY
jgi:hypothetical protein